MTSTFRTSDLVFKMDKENVERLRRGSKFVDQLLKDKNKNHEFNVQFCNGDEFKMLLEHFAISRKQVNGCFSGVIMKIDEADVYLELARKFESDALLEWCSNEICDTVRLGNLDLYRIFGLMAKAKKYQLRHVFQCLVTFLCTDHLKDDDDEKEIISGLKKVGLPLGSVYVIMKCLAGYRHGLQKRFDHDFLISQDCLNPECASQVLSCCKCNMRLCRCCGTVRWQDYGNDDDEKDGGKPKESLRDKFCFNCDNVFNACQCSLEECLCLICNQKKEECLQYALCDEINIDDALWQDFLGSKN